jgi:uroporphyrin-III C-methyltransferase/precorrin-2 dehydrogenase/sirohydrochlorin ferrochelatase
MRYLPMFIDLHRRPVLVVGTAAAVSRKASLLARAGAVVTVIAYPAADAELAALAAAGTVTLVERAFVPADVAGAALIIAADGDRQLLESVAAAARAASIPVNVVDVPELSTFIMPAIVDRDPLVVAISSAGTAPVLARQIRARIEAMLPSNLGRLALFAGRFRAALHATRPDGRARRRFWEQFFPGPIAALVLAGDEQAAQERMLAEINRAGSGLSGSGTAGSAAAMPGRVSLVGAGPGDPDLLTLKAQRRLQEADVIVYDRLVSPAIVDAGRRDADRIYVGKAKGSHARSQAEINDLLVEKARAGLRVVRLKGGDPFIFGRGGEELDHLQRPGIAADVVPGITAAAGCAAATGIPLTHRALAQAAVFVTGHGEHGEPDLDWAALARPQQTVVFYMGLSAAPVIAERLIAHGRSRGTPVAVVVSGTLPQQQVLTGSLGRLPQLASQAADGPGLIMIGEVVAAAARATPSAAADPVTALAV